MRNKEGSGAPRGASNQCPRHTSKRHRLNVRGARKRAKSRGALAFRRSTAALRRLLGSAPGRASWNYRVRTGGPSPAPVQRAPRGPVIVPAGDDARSSPGGGVTSPRPREPLSLRRRYVTGDALDEQDFARAIMPQLTKTLRHDNILPCSALRGSRHGKTS